jgi:hypothetical protein
MASSGLNQAGCIPVVVRSWSQGGDPLVKLQVGLMLDRLFGDHTYTIYNNNIYICIYAYDIHI